MTLNYKALMAASGTVTHQHFTQKDTMLYALGLGVGTEDPCDIGELRFIYEDGLQALPTQAVVLGFDPIWLASPEYGISYSHILHLAQSLRLHQPLPTEGTLVSELTVDSVLDKGPGKGAVLSLTRQLRDTEGKLLATVGHVLYLGADGGFGGPRGESPELQAIPEERPPEAIVRLPNRSHLALLYRLSGDTNPLHADPAVARRAGFSMPILHGLCAYGMVGRALLRDYCDNSPERFQRLDVRFSQPVYPGEDLELRVWHLEPGKAAFRLVASQRDVVVEDHGLFEYCS